MTERSRRQPGLGSDLSVVQPEGDPPRLHPRLFIQALKYKQGQRREVTSTSHVSGFLTVTETHPENEVVTKSGDLEVNLGLVWLPYLASGHRDVGTC